MTTFFRTEAEPKYIMALDQGTTSCRAVIFDRGTGIKGSESSEFSQYYPQPGWVEHNAEELYACQKAVMHKVLANTGIQPHEIAAIGITNQRETIVVWDKQTGCPVYNAVVWQCRRTAGICRELEEQGLAPSVKNKTGLIIDAYFSGTKIKWILDTVPGVRQRAERGEILAGTIDTWLMWKLSAGKIYMTDITNASRTMLFNISAGDWDTELLSAMQIPACMLPQIHSSGKVYGLTDKAECGFELPIAAAAGDQQASLFGQLCFEKGETKITYGTGCFLLMNIGSAPIFSRNNLITTPTAALEGEPVQYALEGSIFMAGAIIKWLRDELGIIREAHDCDILAETVSDTNGVVLVPAFTGLGAPHWDMYARGLIIGLTRGVTKAHICRAVLESIAFQAADVLRCMAADSGVVPANLKADGGASVSDIMLQFQADLLNAPVRRSRNIETTALGAALLAGLACGFWKNKQELSSFMQTDKVFVPSITGAQRENAYSAWNRAVERSKHWEQAQ